MPVLRGYFDDSRTGREIVTIAGYVGDADQWDHYETMWPMALANHDVPYFHMKEMASPTGVYKKWHPPEDHSSEIADFFRGLVRVIGTSNLRGFGATVRVGDLAKFNSERNLSVDAYSLAVYGCMLEIAQKYIDEPVEMVFDHFEKVESKLAAAYGYARTDSYHGGIYGKLVLLPLSRNLSFKDVLPLQSADFAAWELRKNHFENRDWFAIENKPVEWDERWAHFKKWSHERYGTELPPARKSFLALFGIAPVEGIVWDYRALCIADEARGGTWT
jgi:hypothetical protein